MAVKIGVEVTAETTSGGSEIMHQEQCQQNVERTVVPDSVTVTYADGQQQVVIRGANAVREENGTLFVVTRSVPNRPLAVFACGQWTYATIQGSD